MHYEELQVGETYRYLTRALASKEFRFVDSHGDERLEPGGAMAFKRDESKSAYEVIHVYADDQHPIVVNDETRKIVVVTFRGQYAPAD